MPYTLVRSIPIDIPFEMCACFPAYPACSACQEPQSPSIIDWVECPLCPPTRSPVRSQNSARHYGHLLQHGTGESPQSPRGRLQSYPHYQTDYAGEGKLKHYLTSKVTTYLNLLCCLLWKCILYLLLDPNIIVIRPLRLFLALLDPSQILPWMYTCILEKNV